MSHLVLSCLVYIVSENGENVDQCLKKPQITSSNVQNQEIYCRRNQKIFTLKKPDSENLFFWKNYWNWLIDYQNG